MKSNNKIPSKGGLSQSLRRRMLYYSFPSKQELTLWHYAKFEVTPQIIIILIFILYLQFAYTINCSLKLK